MVDKYLADNGVRQRYVSKVDADGNEYWSLHSSPDLPPDAATETKQDAQITELQSIVTGVGTDGTSPPALPGGATGVKGWLRYLSSLLPSSLGQKTSSDSLSTTIASDQSTIPVGTAWDVPTAGLGSYAAGTNLITGTAEYVSVDSLGDPQALRFYLQKTGTLTNEAISVRVADDAAGSNATSALVRTINGSSYGSATAYGTSFSVDSTQYIETVDWLRAKFISIIVTSAGTGSGQIRIRRLSALSEKIPTQIEVLPLQVTGTTQASNLLRSTLNVNLANIMGLASATGSSGPSDEDRRLLTDSTSLLPTLVSSPWTIPLANATSTRTVNTTNFTSASGSQTFAIDNPKMIGLVTLELVVAVTGSGGYLDIDFMYENGVNSSIFAKPFPRITTSGTYTTTIFIPRQTSKVFLRYTYGGTAGSTFNVTAPNWIKGAHYGPEMYKNIYYDYTTLASGVATTQIVDMDLHPYAKNIMFRMQLQGSGTLVYENSINGANWFEITGSETVIPTAAAAASAPVYASMNNGLSPLLPLKFLRVKLKTGAVVTSTTSENVYTISN